MALPNGGLPLLEACSEYILSCLLFASKSSSLIMCKECSIINPVVDEAIRNNGKKQTAMGLDACHLAHNGRISL